MRRVAFALGCALSATAGLSAMAAAMPSGSVMEQERRLQVAYEVDVVVAGGSSGAVAAAVAAKEKGATVFLLTDRPYLGEDLCATLNFALPKGTAPAEGLAGELFSQGRQTTPLRVKKALDQALLRAGVRFLTGSYPAEVVTNEKGEFAGITMVNRSGRQFVKAKVLIDATEHAALARQTRLPFSPFKAGMQQFRMRVIGGELQSAPNLKGRTLDWTVGKARPVHEYVFSKPLSTGDWRELCRVEQEFRDLVIQQGVLEHSERMDYHLGTQLDTPEHVTEWPGASKVDLAHFGHVSNPRILVLGKYAALTESAAAAMRMPREFVATGSRLGHEASVRAGQLDWVKGNAFANGDAEPVHAGVGGELSRALRVGVFKQEPFQPNALPVVGRYDVVVVGGGTSGGPAAIGAAERGATTLVIEYLDELGGVGTAGLIGKYWYSLRGGFTKRMDLAVQGRGERWDPVRKADWLRRTIVDAGGDVWFRSFGCGALVDDAQVKGVVVVTPHGRGVVLAKTVIDGTGNSDIAAHAGAQTEFSIDQHGQLSVQLAGYPHRDLGDSINNTCYAIVDDCDAVDLWNLMLSSRVHASRSRFDMGQLVDSRDRRRIVGDYVLTTQDIFLGRVFPDTVAQARATIDVAGRFDSAAFRTSPMLLIKNIKGAAYACNIPYRCFLPKGLSGIIVTGISASTDRDAMTLTRMQADLQNQGYALGIAAGMAVHLNGHTRKIDIGSLQRELVMEGVLSPPQGGFKDSVPMPAADVRKAVANVAEMLLRADWERPEQHSRAATFRSLAVILLHREQSLPLLRNALRTHTASDARVNYAKILSALGDEAGREVLLQGVTSHSWDLGRPLGAKRRYLNSDYREMDQLVIALGRCSGPEVEAALLAKLEELKPGSPWSHYRAMSIALRRHRIQSAVVPLAALLQTPGFAGHARSYSSDKEVASRQRITGRQMNASLRELTTAGVLYSLGDHQDMGRKVLEEYKNEISGHFSRYAEAFLQLEQPKVLIRDPMIKQMIADRVKRIPPLAVEAAIKSQAPKRVPVQPPTVYTAHPSDLLIADFEDEDYGDWAVDGEAFGKGPARIGKTPNTTAGALGTGFVNSYIHGDGPTGSLVSPEFTVKRKHLNFLIGGGNHIGRTCVELLIDGKAVRSSAGAGVKDTKLREVIRWAGWDVGEFKGKQAKVRIVDQHKGGWGHILVDHIYQSDAAVEDR